MLSSLAEDFGSLPGVDVVVPLDGSLSLPFQIDVRSVERGEDDRQVLAHLAAAADWTVVIAPEFDGLLESRCRTVLNAGGRLLGASLDLIQLAADKHRTAELLAAAGLPVPQGMLLAAGESVPADFPRPAVVKPRYGAGSQDVEILRSKSPQSSCEGERRLERFCPGTPTSVAMLCGSAGCFPLPACQQLLSGDGRFTYLGGRLPIQPALARRATDLARKVTESLPAPRGYLGIDLVLGDDPSGRDDVVIEINPRLTTSYVGLRALAEGNLAAALLAVAEDEIPKLSFRGEPVMFRPDGL